MEVEALELIKEVLARATISEEDFCGSVFGLLQSERPDLWRTAVEKAYLRLPRPITDQVRSAMLNYFFTIGDAKQAFEFFPSRSTKFFDAWTMMHVCLELGRLEEAKKVCRYCRGLLGSAKDDFTRASMADALAAYCLHTGDADGAIAVWHDAPIEPAFQRQRLTGMVKARLLQAAQAAEAGLAIVAGTTKERDDRAEVGADHARMLRDAEQELQKLKGTIEGLVPEKRKAELRAESELRVES